MGTTQGRATKGFISVTLILWAVVAISLVSIGGYFMYRYQHAINEANTLRAEKKSAQARATALALLWAKSVDDADARLAKERKDRDELFDSLMETARAIPARPVVLGGTTVKLLDDVSRAANASASSQGNPEAAQAVPVAPVTVSESSIAQYAVLAGEAYADAFNQWKACVDHYNNLRLQEQLH